MDLNNLIFKIYCLINDHLVYIGIEILLATCPSLLKYVF